MSIFIYLFIYVLVQGDFKLDANNPLNLAPSVFHMNLPDPISIKCVYELCDCWESCVDQWVEHLFPQILEPRYPLP